MNTPSVDALKAATQTLNMLGVAGWMSPERTAERTLKAAYAIDQPRLEVERLHAENERLRQTLSHLLLFARGNEHVVGIIHDALDATPQVALRRKEAS